MAYIITNSDGTVLLTLSDGTIDQVSTSLTLIGKNVSSYGQYYNDNLISMLENFATNGIQPRSPLVGQLWYNKNNGRLYAYTVNNVFNPVAIAQVSPTEPVSPNIGDIWINNSTDQLYFTPDGLNFILAGPASTSTSTSTTKTGWYIDVITDTYLNSNTVASLYNNSNLIAIATTATFTFANTFSGMNSVVPGINLNSSIPGNIFNGTALNARTVNTVTNSYISISSTLTQYVNSPLEVLNNGGFFVGSNTDISITVDSTSTYINNNTTNKLFKIYALSSTVSGYFSAMTLNPFDTTYAPSQPSLTFFPTVTTSTVAISGNLVIGSFTITSSTVYSTGTLYLSPNTGTVDVRNVRITSVSTCTTSTDAANKSYVDLRTFFGNSITPPQLGAINNNYTPAGYTTGTTNRLLLTALSTGSTITGLASPGIDGFMTSVVNAGSTGTIYFSHISTLSSTSNQFVCANSGTTSLSPYAGARLQWVNNLIGSTGYWIFN